MSDPQDTGMEDNRLSGIEITLVRVEAMLASHIQRQEEINERLAKAVDGHDYWIDGNGDPGAKVRMDRLEQANTRRDWWGKALALPVIGLAIDWVVKHWGGA